MSSKIIVCDKCRYEGCSVTEVIPDSKKISMEEFARQGKPPYSMDSLQSQEQRKRKYVIACPDCGHSIDYFVHPTIPTPFFGQRGG